MAHSPHCAARPERKGGYATLARRTAPGSIKPKPDLKCPACRTMNRILVFSDAVFGTRTAWPSLSA